MYVVHVEVVFNTISTESKPDLEVSEMFQKQEVISLGCVQQMFKHVIEKTKKKKSKGNIRMLIQNAGMIAVM